MDPHFFPSTFFSAGWGGWDPGDGKLKEKHWVMGMFSSVMGGEGSKFNSGEVLKNLFLEHKSGNLFLLSWV